jgi:hypothetical protein
MALITVSNDKGKQLAFLCRWILSFKLVARQLGARRLHQFRKP